ncbi:LysR family transcriptional regulator [Chromobacterium sp. S0633]|uniref:LysR family transcriptional regulator n=1 Tax=unclassified Chromobacterium TaxID=2641838 RepID=UPI000D32463E|nr:MULTISPECIES: LysR family transcriptional regulator [unclassified Chromobacterium]MCP1289884.1 LysR family transcriptional regulator [Chromobacterium sp. S0633]PTU64439.1 LysR family transcriptional regulator [Chromobacterium sp. Panama]
MSERINFKHLHYFWAVAHAGGVTRAAEQLGVSAQTVSGQISRLEQSLERTLFRQQGRQLVLTEAGHVTLRYADQIFMLGEELQETLEDAQLDKTIRLAAGISDVLPKAIALKLLEPALRLDAKVRLQCGEGDFDELLADLTRHRLDVVLADRPMAAGGSQPFQSWLLMRCPVMIAGAAELWRRYAEGFPASLNQAPMLLPSRHHVLRSQLDQWFEERRIKPDIVAEFDDGALLDAFGRQGFGLFPSTAPSAGDANAPQALGEVDGVWEHYYAIANRRRLQHPGVQAMLQAAIDAAL